MPKLANCDDSIERNENNLSETRKSSSFNLVLIV